MNSSKLIDIFKDGNIVIPKFFIKNYKELKLECEEFMFLMYLYNKGNKFLFDPSMFSEELNLELKDVMNYISILTDKGFIKVEVLKNDKNIMEEVVILDDFYNKLAYLTINEVNNKEVDSNIFEVIEKEFGRTLSPIELEIIKAWLDSNTSEELIREALKEATFNGVSNLRYIDKILYEWGKKGIKSVTDVENLRKNKNKGKSNKDEDVDISDIVDWNWFDEEE